MRPTLPPSLDAQLIAPAFYQDPYPVYDELLATTRLAWSEALAGWELIGNRSLLS